MESPGLSKSQLSTIILLRLLIGWHFLYEAVLKIFNPVWTAKGYLLSAQGPFADLFSSLAGDGIISFIDFLNVYGLLAVGVGLLLGIKERPSLIVGIVLLMFYYLSNPPFPNLSQLGTEGNYWIVNKNLIEAGAMLVLYFFPTAKAFGLEHFATVRSIKKPITRKS